METLPWYHVWFYVGHLAAAAKAQWLPDRCVNCGPAMCAAHFEEVL